MAISKEEVEETSSVESILDISGMESITSVDSVVYTASENWNNIVDTYQNLGNETIVLRFIGLDKMPVNIHTKRHLNFEKALLTYSKVAEVNHKEIELTVRGSYKVDCAEDTVLSCGLNNHDVVEVTWAPHDVNRSPKAASTQRKQNNARSS